MSSQIKDVQERLKQASEARASEISTGEILPSGTFKYTSSSLTELMMWDAFVEQEVRKLKEFFGRSL